MVVACFLALVVVDAVVVVVVLLGSACHWIYRASVTCQRELLCTRPSCEPLRRLSAVFLVCYMTLALAFLARRSSAPHSLAALH